MGAYDRLLELARRERDAAAAGDWERVLRLQDEQAALRDQLAGTAAPAAAVGMLVEAARLNADVQAALRQAMAAIQAELVDLGRGRTAAAGYGAAAERGPQLAWEG